MVSEKKSRELEKSGYSTIFQLYTSRPSKNPSRSFVYPYFKLNIEQDEIRKALLIKQESESIEWFCSFLPFLVFWSNSHKGHLLDREAFIGEGHLIQF